MDTAIVWFRRDLRLADHPALHAALERHERVIAVYIHEPDAEAPWAPGGASRWWLHHSLAALDGQLREKGSRLVLRAGDTLEQLRHLLHSSGAVAVYWNRLYEPAFVARNKQVKDALRADGLIAESFNGALLVEPWSMKTASGEPYRVFTPFWRNASVKLHAQLQSGRVPLPAPERIATPESLPESLPLAGLDLLPGVHWDAGFKAHWSPGEAGALARLEQFADDAAGRYRQRRDLPAVDGTSCLSAPLHFGELSPLQLVARMERLRAAEPSAGVHANAEAYVRELGWREFAHHLLYHFPRTPEAPLHEKFAAFPWRPRHAYAADLAAWQRGRTGFPLIDAGMRQLWQTGWMHNRVRMVVASFLIKNLLVPWQDGARWFWDTLVDADLANNTLGWQWSAGSGADAAPYFRVFNPVLQSTRFDEDGEYIRRWVPELARLPRDGIHAPWQAKAGVLVGAGVKLGQSYPEPIVDLAASRERALAAYDAVKGRA
ncbi:MAG: cryptochrome/photolyase family protein [Panacagrimonas sp.]